MQLENRMHLYSSVQAGVSHRYILYIFTIGLAVMVGKPSPILNYFRGVAAAIINYTMSDFSACVRIYVQLN